MSKYNKTYMECLEIAAARLGTPELAIDIQFAHEDKHYELMQTAAELYLYLSDLHKHSVMQAEGSDEHICKYCGVLTSQPDEDCYKNPNRVEGAAVGQRSVDTNAEARGCETCKHLESENPYPCGKCDESYCMWEAPSGGHL